MKDYKRLAIPKPPIGGKSTVIRDDGTFLLEEGPGLIWHVLCSHAGMHGFEVWDAQLQDGDLKLARQLFTMNPGYLGVWHLNAGFQFGLAIKSVSSQGAHPHAPTLAPVWMAKTDRLLAGLGEKHNQTFHLEKGATKRVIEFKDCVLYEVLIPQMGRGSIHFFDGTGRELCATPQGVNGSFLFEQVFCKDGFSIEVDTHVPMSVSLVWHDTVSAEPGDQRSQVDTRSGLSVV